MFSPAGRIAIPLFMGGIGIFSTGGFYLVSNRLERSKREAEASQFSLEYIFKGSEGKGPICERFKKNSSYNGNNGRESDEKCKDLVYYMWGLWGSEKQPIEWIRADKDIIDNALWSYYLRDKEEETAKPPVSKNTENTNNTSQSTWKAKGLTCKRVEQGNKVIVGCGK